VANEKKVSLLIVAKDQASAVVKATGTAIGKIVKSISASFKLAGGAAGAINQGLELIKKALGAVGAAYDATIGKALELRGANDPARKDLEALAKAATDLQVAVGDALMPVVRAFAQALKPVIDAATKWVKANQDLITTKVTEWVTKAASVITSTLGVAITLIVRAWYGWLMAIDLVKVAVNEAFASILGASASVLDKFGEIADRFGKGALANNLREAATAARGIGGEFSASSEEASAAMAANLAELEKIEGAIAKVEAAIQKGIGEAGTKALKNMKSAVVGLGEDLQALADMQMADLVIAMEQFLALNAKTQMARGFDDLSRSLRTAGTEFSRLATQAEIQDQLATGLAELRKQYGGAADAAFQATGSIAGATAALSEQEEKLSTVRDVVGSVIGSIGSAFTGMIDAAIDGTQSASDIIGGFFSSIGRSILDTLVSIGVQYAATKLTELILGKVVSKSAIAGYAATAGAAAVASTAAIPIFGPVAAPAAGAAAFSAAMAYQALALADGGLVRGGMSGRDSVPALMMPVELVTPFADVQRNVREGRAPGDGGLPRRGERGRGGITVNATITSLFPMSQAETRRNVSGALVPELAHASRSGRLKAGR
jgi:hypothetical protein